MFTAARPRLASSLAWVSRSLPTRPPMPVLAGIRLTVTDGVLTMSGMDVEQSAAATMEVDGDDIDVIVSGRLLADLVKAVTGETVTFEIDDQHLSLTSGRSKFSLPLFAIEQYPALPAIPGQFGVVTGRVFADAIRQVVPAASTDHAVPVMSAIYVQANPEEETLTFAATDRYRLATTTIPYVPAPGTTTEIFLIPARVLGEYGKTFADAAVVNLHHGGNDNVLFGVTGDARTATTRLVEGTFPDFARLLPTEFAATIDVPVAEFAAAVRRVSLVAESDHTVRVTFTEGEVTIAVGDAGSLNSANESIDIDYTGEEFALRFNHGYLLDGLANLDADKVRVRLTAPNKPALLSANDESDPFRYLLMPVRS